MCVLPSPTAGSRQVDPKLQSGAMGTKACSSETRCGHASSCCSPWRASGGGKSAAAGGGRPRIQTWALPAPWQMLPGASRHQTHAHAASPYQTLRQRLGKKGAMPEALSTNLPITKQGLLTALEILSRTHPAELVLVPNHEVTFKGLKTYHGEWYFPNVFLKSCDQ